MIRTTNSQRTTAQTCLRKHYLMYERGIRRKRSAAPLRIGDAVHMGIDLRARGHAEWLTLTMEYVDRRAPIEDEEALREHEYERQLVYWLLVGYDRRWADDPLELVASERVCEHPIVDNHGRQTGYANAGKIDRVYRLPSGALALGETKTTSDDVSDPTCDYWRRLRIDSQISSYLLLLRATGFDVTTVLYDVLRKPRLKPRQMPLLDDDGRKVVVDEQTGERVYTASGSPRQVGGAGMRVEQRRETPEEYGERVWAKISDDMEGHYIRREIPRLDRDLEEARFDVLCTTQVIDHCRREHLWPKNTRACFANWSACPMFDLCAHGFDPDSDPLPEAYQTITDIHPELADE